MSTSRITLAVLAIGVSIGAASAPALAERSVPPKKAVETVKAPVVASFAASGGSGYTRQLWNSNTYAGSFRSK